MRPALLVIGTALALVAFWSAPVFAADLHDATGASEGLLDLVKLHAGSWNAKLRSYALSVFWLLVPIQAVLKFYPFLFKQLDFPDLFGEIIRFILTIGFFLALLQYSQQWAEAIINSFRQAGAAAAGNGIALRPGEMFGMAVEISKMVANVDVWKPLDAFMVAISSIIILLSFAFLSALLQVTLIESYIIINAAVFFMGFGALEWARDYAIAMWKYAVAVGAKLLMLTLIVGLVMTIARALQGAYKHDETSMLSMLGLAFVAAYLSKTIIDNVQGLISGVSPGGGSPIGGMAAAAVAGGAAGLAAASQFMTTSGMLSGGGVMDSIKSSLGMGAAGGSSSSPSSMMNSASNSGSSNSAKGPSSRVGGGGSPKSFSSGSFTPGASSTPSTPSSSGQTAQAASNPQGTGPSAASVAHNMAAGAVRTGGVLAAMTVPGMESAADISIAGPEPKLGGGADSQVGETPENVIRPVAESAQEQEIDTMSSLQEAMNNRGNKE